MSFVQYLIPPNESLISLLSPDVSVLQPEPEGENTPLAPIPIVLAHAGTCRQAPYELETFKSLLS